MLNGGNGWKEEWKVFSLSAVVHKDEGSLKRHVVVMETS